DGFCRRIRLDGGILGAVVRRSEQRRLLRIATVCGSDRNGSGRGNVAVQESRLVDRKVREPYALQVVVIDEGSDILAGRAHLVADIVKAHLPADKVRDILVDEVQLLGMS